MATQRNSRAKRALRLAVEGVEERILCSVTVTVPGTANPYLADPTNKASFGFLPELTDGTKPIPINVTGDTLLTFAVTGGTTFEPGSTQSSPDGDSGLVVTASYGARGAVSSWNLPIDSLAGVFLGSTLGSAPAKYPAGGPSASNLSPLLGQVFPIGDGITGAGTTGSVQIFHVPAGATKLYLANIDAHKWSDNGGLFSVTVTQTSPNVAINTSLQGIHRLIYPGQTLAVPIVVTNTGTAAITGFANINLYLSMNNNPAARGTATKTYLGQSLNIAAGKSQTITLPLTIPTTQTVGTYYIKAVITSGTSGSVVPSFLKNGDFIAVSPALTEIDTTISTARAGVYEKAVALAKTSPNYVPLQFAVYGFTTEGIKSYIKSNEESGVFKNYPYLDSKSIPTIGWGFALLDADGNPIATAVARITALGLNFNTVVADARINGPANSPGTKISFPQLTLTYGNSWLDQIYTQTVNNLSINLLVQPSPQNRLVLDQLPENIQAVMIDMAYNMGPAFVNKFPKMLAYIQSNKLAFAGFELLNSDYATQVPNRATNNFRLLVSGQEGDL